LTLYVKLPTNNLTFNWPLAIKLHSCIGLGQQVNPIYMGTVGQWSRLIDLDGQNGLRLIT
jgi:hypothetical protein